jgi:hypothetical protein
MIKCVALSASALAFVTSLAFAETTMTREPSTGRSVVTNPSSSLSIPISISPMFMILLNTRSGISLIV